MSDLPVETGLILPVRLPRQLEKIRLDSVVEATRGLPAHITLLYPFAPPNALDRGMRARIARIVGDHSSFGFRLAGSARFPGVLYASVEPEAPFVSLQADLAAEFPALPVYGGAFEFVPHITIAEGTSADLPGTADRRAWASLPLAATARSVQLIVRSGGTWRVAWRMPLGEPATGRPRTT
jgi:2'-5' RNA ligase